MIEYISQMLHSFSRQSTHDITPEIPHPTRYRILSLYERVLYSINHIVTNTSMHFWAHMDYDIAFVHPWAARSQSDYYTDNHPRVYKIAMESSDGFFVILLNWGFRRSSRLPTTASR